MLERLIVAFAVLGSLATAGAADREQLRGTWKLVKEQRKILETGETIDLDSGSIARGYITYSSNGRMLVLIVRGMRPKPTSAEAMTEQQRADLFRTMVAYGGTYEFDGRTVKHHVDISWNEIWTGTTQVREVQKQGDKLIFTGQAAPYSGDGRMSVVTLVWEKID